MSLKAGFAETDITPPVGTHKIGWLRDIVSDRVLDPLYARAATLTTDTAGVGFVQLDTLSVRWTTTMEIRRRIEARCGFPGRNVMVAATHNHGGPAVANCGDVQRDDSYVESMVEKAVAAFGEALEASRDAELAFGRALEFRLSRNRRILMRDGTVQTHGDFTNSLALCFEGPIDPEVGVLAARGEDGDFLGAVVNFTCHPTHHGPSGELSAGYPGALVAEMKRRGWPVTLFLNGASGNIHDSDPTTQERRRWTMEQMGRILAEDAERALEATEWTAKSNLGSRSASVELPFRQPTQAEIEGTVRGAQRFVDPEIYRRGMPELLERIRRMGIQPAEVQVIFVGDWAFVGIPAEYFVQHGLRIKEAAHPLHALVAGHANGMVGYVPHREAFERGGYETTFGPNSRLAPEAGDILAQCAIDLIEQGVPR